MIGYDGFTSANYVVDGIKPRREVNYKSAGFTGYVDYSFLFLILWHFDKKLKSSCLIF